MFDTYINKGSIDVVQSLGLEYHPPFVSCIGTMERDKGIRRYEIQYSRNQTPRLLFISSRNFVRLHSRAATNRERHLLNSGMGKSLVNVRSLRKASFIRSTKN